MADDFPPGFRSGWNGNTYFEVSPSKSMYVCICVYVSCFFGGMGGAGGTYTENKWAKFKSGIAYSMTFIYGTCQYSQEECCAPFQQSVWLNIANQKQTAWTDWECPVSVSPNLQSHSAWVHRDNTGAWRKESVEVLRATLNGVKRLEPKLKMEKHIRHRGRGDSNHLSSTAFEHASKKSYSC